MLLEEIGWNHIRCSIKTKGKQEKSERTNTTNRKQLQNQPRETSRKRKQLTYKNG